MTSSQSETKLMAVCTLDNGLLSEGRGCAAEVRLANSQTYRCAVERPEESAQPVRVRLCTSHSIHRQTPPDQSGSPACRGVILGAHLGGVLALCDN